MSAISTYGSFASNGVSYQGATLSSAANYQRSNVSAYSTSRSAAQQSGFYCATCNSGSTTARSSSPTSTYCPTCNKNTGTVTSASINNAVRSGSSANAGGRLISACPTCGTAYAQNR